MSGGMAAPAPSPWQDALHVAALFARDPHGLGGVVLRALPGPVRDRWLAALRAALPVAMTLRRVPLNVADDRLLGGLDLAATLQAGRPVLQVGLLSEADGGVVLLAMAEQRAPGEVARLAAVLDSGVVALQRDGLERTLPARIGVVALDEGMAEEERTAPALADRLAFLVDLTAIGLREAADGPQATGLAVPVASVRAAEAVLEGLSAAALALGVFSLRAPLLALRAARAAAALAGRREVSTEDAALAARLVLAPRATRLPQEAPPPEAEAPPPEMESGPDGADRGDAPAELPTPEEPASETPGLEDIVLAAAQAAIPAGLLAELRLADGMRARARLAGAALRPRAALRGRPAGVRRGAWRAGARLHLVETLRAAAPWQTIRRPTIGQGAASDARIAVRPEDFRLRRFTRRARTTTIFVVDASGSAALHRLGEAKGAVELLLAQCYVRRDRVALIAFRGRTASLLLPPTASLLRARRSLAGLAGGGGTPLAAGIDAAVALADNVARAGDTPLVVLLTDGQANIAADGTPGRPAARLEAEAAARRARIAGVRVLLIDTAPKPQPLARSLATLLAAQYLPLPQADASQLSRAIAGASARRVA